MVLGQHCTFFLRHAFDVHVMMHRPRVPMPCLQVLHGFSRALPRALFTVSYGAVRRDRIPKERCDRGRPVPMAVRIATVMLVYVYGMIAQDRMKLGGFLPIVLARVPADGEDCVSWSMGTGFSSNSTICT